MDYLKFTLFFCLVAVIFEWTWTLVSAILMKIILLFESEKAFKISMVIDKILYCLLFVILSALSVGLFREYNKSVLFAIFCVAIPEIYFVFFSEDKRINTEKNLRSNMDDYRTYIMLDQLKEKAKVDRPIEFVSLLLFLPLAFFPEIVTNAITSKIFDAMLYVWRIKYLGILIGVFGAFSLFKYLRSILIMPLIILKDKNN